MRPTLLAGDLCLVLWGCRPRAGTVAVVALPGRPLGVKRLVRWEPAGWWLAGDNPSASTDSRHFGVVAAEAVRGRVLLRYWPPARRPVVLRRLPR